MKRIQVRALSVVLFGVFLALLNMNLAESACNPSATFIQPSGDSFPEGPGLDWTIRYDNFGDSKCFPSTDANSDGPGPPQVKLRRYSGSSATGSYVDVGGGLPVVNIPPGGFIVVYISGLAPIPAPPRGQYTYTPVYTSASSYNSLVNSADMKPLKTITFGTNEVESLTITQVTVPEGSPATVTVTLSWPATTSVVVNLFATGTGVTMPSTLTVQAGRKDADFIATGSAPGSITFAAKRDTSTVQKQVTLNISAIEIVSIALDRKSIKTGQRATGTITMSERAGQGGIPVELSASSDIASVPASVVIPFGKTTANFIVTAGSRPGSATISAGRPGKTEKNKQIILEVTE